MHIQVRLLRDCESDINVPVKAILLALGAESLSYVLFLIVQAGPAVLPSHTPLVYLLHSVIQKITILVKLNHKAKCL